MIPIGAAVEDGFLDAKLQLLLRQTFPRGLRGIDLLRGGFRRAFAREGGRGSKRLAGGIIDKLRVQVAVAAEDAQARAGRGAVQFRAHTNLPAHLYLVSRS